MWPLGLSEDVAVADCFHSTVSPRVDENAAKHFLGGKVSHPNNASYTAYLVNAGLYG